MSTSNNIISGMKYESQTIIISSVLVVRAWAKIYKYALLYLARLRDIKSFDVFLCSKLSLSPLIYKFKAVHSSALHYLSPARTHSHTLAFLLNPLVVILHLDGHFILQTRSVVDVAVALISTVITQYLKFLEPHFPFSVRPSRSSRTINSDELLVAFKVDSRTLIVESRVRF